MEQRRFRVLVPQEFEQAYYVTATSEDEAIELVNLAADEARARGVELKWSESEFVCSKDTEYWEVEVSQEITAEPAATASKEEDAPEAQPHDRTLYYEGLPVPNHPRVELVSTRLITRVAEPGPKLCGPDDAGTLLCELIGNCDREVAVALHLDPQLSVASVDVLSVGTLDRAPVHPREVFKAAILANARAIIFAHNHPSGDLEPSSADIDVTERLAKAGEILGIPVVDSIIVQRERYVQVDPTLLERFPNDAQPRRLEQEAERMIPDR